MRFSTCTIAAKAIVLVALLVAIQGISFANGTETLGPPSIAIATGSGFVANGVGLALAQPAPLILVVPPAVTIKQVLVYWEGQSIGPVGDNDIVVNGVLVPGTSIGGPTFFFSAPQGSIYSTTYRADVTTTPGVGTVVVPGPNVFTVSGLTFSNVNDGAGIIVIYDDGVTPTSIQIRDGNDLAYLGFGGSLQTTVPQTFTFAAAGVSRSANLSMFVSSVDDAHGFRPTRIVVTTSAGTTNYDNVLNSSNGKQWDTFNQAVTIPAGSTQMTVEVQSGVPGDVRQPASLCWNTAGLSVPPPPRQTCGTCNGQTITVDTNVTVNFNTNPPTYTGDLDLKPYFTWDNSGPTADTWNAIFDVGGNKLLVKSGATITVNTVPLAGSNRYSPGIVIKSTCELQMDSGSAVIVNSFNRNAGDIFLKVDGNITINGTVRNEVSGTLGLPGSITITSKCGDITEGRTGLVWVEGVDPGGNDINIKACGDDGSGNIVINGLVISRAHAHGGDLTLNRPTINVAAFAGTVVVNANTAEPYWDEHSYAGGLFDIYPGLLSWVRDNVPPGKVQVQASGNITVNGHGTDPTGPVRESFGALAAIAIMSSAPGGVVDVRSIGGSVNGNNRAFDVSGRNRLATNYALIRLWAAQDISLSRPGINATYNPVADASGSGVGDKGGKNEFRAFSGNITVNTGALVTAAVPPGSGSVQGVNDFTYCGSFTNNGTVTPAPVVTPACGPPAPNPLWTDCSSFGQLLPKTQNEVQEVLPTRTGLLPNYPNPFNPSTTVVYELEKAANVTIRIFNTLGQEVGTLVNERQTEGRYSIRWEAVNMPAGVYFVRMQWNEFVSTQKMLLVK